MVEIIDIENGCIYTVISVHNVKSMGTYFDGTTLYPECPYAEPCSAIDYQCKHPEGKTYCGFLNLNSDRSTRKCPFDIHKELNG